MRRIAVISLWQPWASLWVSGVKVQETRDYAFPSKHHGATVAVHAAKRRFTPANISDALHDLCCRVLGANYWLRLPYGAVVGEVELVRWERAATPATPDDAICGFFGPERYGWMARSPVVYPQPIPLRGRQGFFYWDGAPELASL